MRVAFISRKGGVGKTTVAVYLATWLAKRGRVLLIDADPAGDVVGWEKLARAASGVVLPFRVVPATSGAELYGVASAASGYDHIVIDTPVRTDRPARQDHEPDDDGLLHAAAAVCDLVVLPAALSGLDLQGGAHTVEVLAEQQARTRNSETLQGRVLLNRTGGPITPRALTLVREHLAGWPVLGAAMVDAPHYPASYGGLPWRLDAVAAVGNVLLNEVDALTPPDDPDEEGLTVEDLFKVP